MKKLFLILVLGNMLAGCFATSEFNLVDGEESWGSCYITEENQAEWDEENAKIEAILEYPELADVFALLDAESEN